MKLQYRDGRWGEDELFDMPKSLQVMHVVHCMNLDPSTPKMWPNETIGRLLEVRRQEGQQAFDNELRRLMTP